MEAGDGPRLVAEHAQLTKGTVTQLASYLECHEFVERVRDPSDGEACSVRPTAAAQTGYETFATQNRGVGGRLAGRRRTAEVVDLRRGAAGDRGLAREPAGRIRPIEVKPLLKRQVSASDQLQ